MKHKTTKTRALLTAAVVTTTLLTTGAQAQENPSGDAINRLEKRIEELEKKLRELEAQKVGGAPTNAAIPQPQLEQVDQTLAELQQKQDATARTNDAVLSRLKVGEEGFQIRSADDRYDIQLRGVLQVDTRTFLGNSAIVGNDGILLRRARPILQGTVFRDIDFQFVPDFGGSNPQIFDAWLNYRFSPALQLQGGKFKTPVGLELLQQDKDLLFNERALPSDLVPNRDVGFALHGELFTGRLTYAAGIFNGVGDGRNSSNVAFQDDKSFVGRIFVEPFKDQAGSPLRGLGFGVAGSFDTQQATNTAALPATTGGSLAGFATVGQQEFFAFNPSGSAVVVANGDHWRLSPQGYYYYGPFGLLGEYVISDQQVSRTVTVPHASARLEDTGWQIVGSWVLTGEAAAYAGGVNPKHPFDPLAGRWGAWQIVARYSELNVDSAAFPRFANPATSARSAHEWSVGLNWYLNRNVKFATSFAHTTFDGGGSGTSVPGIVNKKDENVLFTRLQLAF